MLWLVGMGGVVGIPYIAWGEGVVVFLRALCLIAFASVACAVCWEEGRVGVSGNNVVCFPRIVGSYAFTAEVALCSGGSELLGFTLVAGVVEESLAGYTFR